MKTPLEEFIQEYLGNSFHYVGVANPQPGSPGYTTLFLKFCDDVNRDLEFKERMLKENLSPTDLDEYQKYVQHFRECQMWIEEQFA